jgi:hypothetical protein
MEKVQQDNDPNGYSKQPKCNSTHNFLLSTQYSSHGNTDCHPGPCDCNILAIQVPECTHAKVRDARCSLRQHAEEGISMALETRMDERFLSKDNPCRIPE